MVRINYGLGSVLGVWDLLVNIMDIKMDFCFVEFIVYLGGDRK